MKKIFLLAPLLLFLAVVGCKKVDQLLTFNVDVSQSTTIRAILVGAGPIAAAPVTTNSADSFRNNKTSKDKVKDVYLNKMALTITDPAGLTFDFLDKVEIYISTNSNNRILLARLDNVPKGVTTVTLVPTTSRLDEYLKSDTYTLDAIYTSNTFRASPFTVRSDATFKVTADPL
jgi:ABC-type Fe3+-hydroxamate transport system substrate-binding protein